MNSDFYLKHIELVSYTTQLTFSELGKASATFYKSMLSEI